MLKYAVVIAMAGMAAVPFVERGPKSFIVGGSMKTVYDDSMFVVSSVDGQNCKLMTLYDRSSDLVRVSPQSECAMLSGLLDTVRFWRLNSDGTVELDDSQGRAIMALAPQGSAAFRTIGAATPSLTFSRTEI